MKVSKWCNSRAPAKCWRDLGSSAAVYQQTFALTGWKQISLQVLNEFTPTAFESGCTVLYSEDMQAGQLIDDTLTIKNPFRA